MMSQDSQIQVFETTNITRLSVAKLALDNAGIPYNSLYENTLQLDGVYAMGQNGAQLMVNEADVARANEILSEAGLMNPTMDEEPSSIQTFSESLGKYPILKSIPANLRFLVLIGGILIIGFLILSYFLLRKDGMM